MASDDSLWNGKQTAEYLGITERSLRDWRAKGLVPFIPWTTKTVRYNPDVLRALAEKKQMKNTTTEELLKDLEERSN